jgi:hypothetical protein
MKYLVALLLALFLHNVSFSAEGEVQETSLTITGHYRSMDGRVKEHKFPIEFRLRSDGSFDGTIESWVEAELTDGRSRLDYYKAQVSGKWAIKDNVIHIVMEQEGMAPQIVFKKMNGLSIKIDKKTNS